MKFPFPPSSRRFAKLAGVVALALTGFNVAAQAVTEVGAPPAVIPVDSEPPAALHLYPPVPAALARGVVILQFKTENFRVIPVFGKAAVGVSPRVGHLHVTVDGMALTWAHTSGDPIIVVGLKPGAHEILVELADPSHQIVTARKAEVILPETKTDGPPASGSVHRH